MGTVQKDKNSHWKIVFAVGVCMGIHLVITLIAGAFIDDPESLPKFVASLIYTDFKIMDFVYYLPIAFIYIAAMAVGYFGLRYIELSVSSPICNSSGSLALVICAIIGVIVGGNYTVEMDGGSIAGVVLVAVGIIGLGIAEYLDNDEAKALRQDKSNFKYTKSVWAILIPIIYLILDALGTVGDQVIAVGDFGIEISDYAANSAFELMFVLYALFAFIWVKFVKKDKMFNEKTKFAFLGGACETIGQAFYMAVMFSDFDAGMVIISAYCALSVLWSRIFLKEKLSLPQYITIGVTFVGIVLLGVFSPV
jgi:uncharacterized membrane protein